MGLSCLLIWPCFFGPFLDLSYFPPEDWTCLAPFGLASLHRTQRCLGPFPRVARDSFPEQVFLALNLDPCHRVFVDLNFELRVVVGLGWLVILHTSCTRASELWDSLSQFVDRFPQGPDVRGALDSVPLATLDFSQDQVFDRRKSSWQANKSSCCTGLDSFPGCVSLHLPYTLTLAVASSGRLDTLDRCPTWIVSLLSRR